MSFNSPSIRKLAVTNTDVVGRAHARAAGQSHFLEGDALLRASEQRLLSMGYAVKAWLRRQRAFISGIAEVVDKDTMEPRGFRCVRFSNGRWDVRRAPMISVLKLRMTIANIRKETAR